MDALGLRARSRVRIRPLPVEAKLVSITGTPVAIGAAVITFLVFLQSQHAMLASRLRPRLQLYALVFGSPDAIGHTLLMDRCPEWCARVGTVPAGCWRKFRRFRHLIGSGLQ